MTSSPLKIGFIGLGIMVGGAADTSDRVWPAFESMDLAPASARALGVALPNTAMAQELFNSCVAHGGRAWDHSAMVRALEKLANFEIGQAA